MTKRVYIIGSRNSKKNDVQRIQEILSSSHCVQLMFWEDINFFINKGSVKVQFGKIDVIEERPDLVIAFGWYRNDKNTPYRDIAYSLALVLDHNNIRYWNQEMNQQRSVTKLSCMVQLALNDISVPKTYFALQYNECFFDMPFIYKAVSASRGKDNFLINSFSEIAAIQNRSTKAFMSQEFLKNDHDLRVICFGGKPTLVLKRSANKSGGSHLNNTSKGGAAQWMDLSKVPSSVLTLSMKICKITKKDMAGIDFIPNRSSLGGYSCLEVNAIPQLTSGFESEKKLNALLSVVQEEMEK